MPLASTPTTAHSASVEKRGTTWPASDHRPPAPASTSANPTAARPPTQADAAATCTVSEIIASVPSAPAWPAAGGASASAAASARQSRSLPNSASTASTIAYAPATAQTRPKRVSSTSLTTSASIASPSEKPPASAPCTTRPSEARRGEHERRAGEPVAQAPAQRVVALSEHEGEHDGQAAERHERGQAREAHDVLCDVDGSRRAGVRAPAPRRPRPAACRRPRTRTRPRSGASPRRRPATRRCTSRPAGCRAAPTETSSGCGRVSSPRSTRSALES